MHYESSISIIIPGTCVSQGRKLINSSKYKYVSFIKVLNMYCHWISITLLHSEWSELHRVLAVLSAIRLINEQ